MTRPMRTPRWIALACLACPPAFAGDLDNLGNLAQDEFRKIAENIGAVTSYKAVTPATPLGIVGFDIGLIASTTSIENSDLMARAGAGNSDATAVKLDITKGLPLNFDIGAFVGALPDYSATLYGANLRWAFMDDTATTPAIATRIAYTSTSGLGVESATASIDLMVSKRFAMATPYLGVGAVRAEVKPDSSHLSEEKFNQSRVFAGLNVNLAVINLAFEAEKQGDNTTLSAKVGWRF